MARALGLHAPGTFDPARPRPRGADINLGGPDAVTVRALFVHDALDRLEEHRLDGRRLDAVHALPGAGRDAFLDELAVAVRSGPGARRQGHLVPENDLNEARPFRPDARGRRACAARWNDDLHHCFYILATGEHDGSCADHADPAGALVCCLTEGFAHQGAARPAVAGRGASPRRVYR